MRKAAPMNIWRIAQDDRIWESVESDVTVDGVPIAKLDVRQSLILGSGALGYKINSLKNVTDFSSKGFTLLIPADTHKPNQVPMEHGVP